MPIPERCEKCGTQLDRMGLCNNSECPYYAYKDKDDEPNPEEE